MVPVPHPDEEAALIGRSRLGDAEAFARLVAVHQSRVRAYIGASVRRPDVVDDLAQDVFLDAFRGLDGFKGDAPLAVWLLGIARNKTLMYLRTELRRQTREAGTLEAVLAPFRARQAEDDEKELLRREREIAALLRCVEALPPPSAALVAERYFKARSVSDVARVLGKREGAIRMTLLRVRQALRSCVERRLAGEGG